RYDDRKPGGAPVGWTAAPGGSIYRGSHAGGRSARNGPRGEQPSEISGDRRQQVGCPEGAKTAGQDLPTSNPIGEMPKSGSAQHIGDRKYGYAQTRRGGRHRVIGRDQRQQRAGHAQVTTDHEQG